MAQVVLVKCFVITVGLGDSITTKPSVLYQLTDHNIRKMPLDGNNKKGSRFIWTPVSSPHSSVSWLMQLGGSDSQVSTRRWAQPWCRSIWENYTDSKGNISGMRDITHCSSQSSKSCSLCSSAAHHYLLSIYSLSLWHQSSDEWQPVTTWQHVIQPLKKPRYRFYINWMTRCWLQALISAQSAFNTLSLIVKTDFRLKDCVYNNLPLAFKLSVSLTKLAAQSHIRPTRYLTADCGKTDSMGAEHPPAPESGLLWRGGIQVPQSSQPASPIGVKPACFIASWITLR